MSSSHSQYPPPKEATLPMGMPGEAMLVAAAMACATLLAPHRTHAGPYLNEVMLLGFGGFLLFLVAKVSLFGNGRFTTWGPKPMRMPFKAAYLAGYLLMVVSQVALAALS